MSSLNDIDDRIAKLEAALNDSDGSDSGSDSDSGSNDSDSSDDSGSAASGSSGSSSDDDAIPALPANCLPEFYAKPKMGSNVGMSEFQKLALKAYKPIGGRGNFCRECQMQLVDVAALQAHRLTQAHQGAVKREQALSYCRVCGKQFTSIVQYNEHCKGRAHLEKAKGGGGGGKSFFPMLKGARLASMSATIGSGVAPMAVAMSSCAESERRIRASAICGFGTFLSPAHRRSDLPCFILVDNWQMWHALALVLFAWILGTDVVVAVAAAGLGYLG